MATYQQPPRGLSARNTGSPLATARWAATDETIIHSYRAGDIFLGTISLPAQEAATALSELGRFRDQLRTDTIIDSGWKATQFDIIAQHEAKLRATSSRMIGINDDRHMITIAGTRSGKGTSAIVANLCLYPGSAIIIDPKGELTALTAERRGGGSDHCEGMNQKLAALDPYGTNKNPAVPRATWNPLDLIKNDDPEAVDKAASLAQAIMIKTKGDDAHFDENAETLILGLILYVALVYGDRPGRNLVTVHDLLMRGAYEDLDPDRDDHDTGDAMLMLLCQMEQMDAFDGVIANAAATLLGMAERERGSVLSTARRNMRFIGRRAMREVLKSSSFDLDTIKNAPEGMTVFLCLPQQRLADCSRWLRLMINSTLERIYDLPDDPATGHPILFLLEEFASLKHMESIETAAGYAAGFGVKMWLILQDLSQLKRYYKEGWETFIANAGVIQAFGNSDMTTLEYLSKKLGEVEVTQRVQSVTESLSASTNDPGDAQRIHGLFHNRGALSLINPLPLLFDDSGTGKSASTTTATNEQIHRSPMMLANEIEMFFRRESMKQLILLKGLPPMIIDRVNYYDHPILRGFYEPSKGQKMTIAAARDFRQNENLRQKKAAAVVIEQARLFVRTTDESIQKAKQARR